MFKTLNTAATGMQAQQTNMEVISHNISNVGTNGFKKSRAEFEDLLYQTQREPGSASGLNSITPTGVQTGLGVRTNSIQKNFESGSPQITKGALDLMVEGQGFFSILMPDGQLGYTRNGSFGKDAAGRVVDKNGNLLQPEITIPPNTLGLEVKANGEVHVSTSESGATQAIGRIDLVNFVNPAGLKAVGRNLFVPTAASGQPIPGAPGQAGFGSVAQGQLESSNVNIVDEMVNMITAQRAYETNSKVVQAADQMLQYTNSIR